MVLIEKHTLILCNITSTVWACFTASIKYFTTKNLSFFESFFFPSSKILLVLSISIESPSEPIDRLSLLDLAKLTTPIPFSLELITSISLNSEFIKGFPSGFLGSVI